MVAKASNRATRARTVTAKAVAKGEAMAKAAAHIMAAPKGPRTVSHRKIVAAVEKVFRAREHAGG
jgi:hypothetical protein